VRTATRIFVVLFIMLEAVAALGMVVIGGHGRVVCPLSRPLRPPLPVMISGTRYGDLYNGNLEWLTRGSCDLAEMHRAVLAEELPPCAPP